MIDEQVRADLWQDQRSSAFTSPASPGPQQMIRSKFVFAAMRCGWVAVRSTLASQMKAHKADQFWKRGR